MIDCGVRPPSQYCLTYSVYLAPGNADRSHRVPWRQINLVELNRRQGGGKGSVSFSGTRWQPRRAVHRAARGAQHLVMAPEAPPAPLNHVRRGQVYNRSFTSRAFRPPRCAVLNWLDMRPLKRWYPPDRRLFKLPKRWLRNSGRRVQSASSIAPFIPRGSRGHVSILLG